MAIDTTTVEVVMPAMGDSVSEGTVLEWRKAEGDSVSADETLVEISTDKVDAEVPAPIDGIVVKVHAAEGDTIHVGAVLAEIAPSNGAAPAASAEPAPAAAAEPEQDAPAAAQDVDIVMPAMGESVSEGVVLEWAKAVGESIEADATIVEISTDKVDAEVPAPASGTVTEILAEAGETVSVGQVIGRMRGAAVGARSETSQPAPTEPAAQAVTDNGATQPASAAETGKATPVARRVAAAHGVELGRVHGSGPDGRIGKQDVLAVANGAAAAHATAGATQIKGASAMLARYMDESREVPTATSFRTLAVTTLDARRKQLKDAGQRVSFTHLIAYAIARAATEQMPVMTHHFEAIDGKPHVIDDGACNLGIA
ncbi:MAG: E3 binding domain-containing protein, partial [Solirubrobacterales bacterium]|nr:E3 binding domain-containing protein [Solirubrobacterales bacterium]